MTIISNSRKLQLKHLQKILRVSFKNLSLLDKALTHRSYGNEHRMSVGNYERLEFLGDSILGFVTAEYLYMRYPDLDEGRYSKIKSAVVSEESLSHLAASLHYGEYILIGHGEEKSGGRSKKAILADVFEAVIGAYYLDTHNMSRVRNFILRFIAKEVELVVDGHHESDYKSLLQEYCQKNYNACPSYKIVGESGPEHAKTFRVSVTVADKVTAEGVGNSKKDAEKNAAEHAYRKICSAVETKTQKTAAALDSERGRSHSEEAHEPKKPGRRRKNKPTESEGAPKKFYENIDFASVRKQSAKSAGRKKRGDGHEKQRED